MKKFIAEFKAFISRGNVIDLAVGVVIGGAFAKIIASLVKDIFMPLIALITGRNLNDLVWVLKAVENPNPLSTEGTAVADAAGNITYYTTYITMNWGIFLQTVIDFLLVALLVFVIIKALAAASKAGADLKKKVEEKLPVKEEKK